MSRMNIVYLSSKDTKQYTRHIVSRIKQTRLKTNKNKKGH